VIEAILYGMGVMRIVLGLAPFVAARPVSRMLAVPESHDNPTARLMGRLFGVRDIGLGVLVFFAIKHPEILPFVMIFNALTDFGDLFAILIPIVRRQGIDRAATRFAAFALPAGVAWLVMLRFV
jgi:hypothetical protein